MNCLRVHRFVQLRVQLRVELRPLRLAVALAIWLGLPLLARADLAAQIEAVKPSVVVVGYFKATNNPRFALTGTGFAVGDGRLLITNAHVLADGANVDAQAQLQVLVRRANNVLESRNATVVEVDRVHDLALLRIGGEALPALKLRDSGTVREGQRNTRAQRGVHPRHRIFQHLWRQ